MAGKILVPVDFSHHTLVSCHYALYLAGKTRSDIVLFHSFFDQIYFSDGGFATGFESGIMLTDELILDFYRKKEDKLKDIGRGMIEILKKQGESGISVTCLMESGDPEVQILIAIKKSKPDMIVMGSSGMGKKGLFSGSVARRIMDQTSIPVFAVPNVEHIPEISHIAYMTIFDPSDQQSIGNIRTMLTNLKHKIFCLHICPPFKEAESIAEMEKLSANMADDLKNQVSFHVKPGNDPEDILQEFIGTHAIDLLAFIPHKRNVFKSFSRQNLTKEDLFLTNIPILAIPAGSSLP